MRKIILLFLTIIFSIATIAQTNSLRNILIFNVIGINYELHLKNGEKSYGDSKPITDGRKVIFDFDNNTIYVQKNVYSPFKIINHSTAQNTTIYNVVFDVIGRDKKPAKLHLVLLNYRALLYIQLNNRPGLLHVYDLAYE